MTNLDSILKSRDITLLTKVHTVRAMVFPIAMYGCESWTIKKAECQRIDAYELWCWKRLLRVPWTARRSKQSILQEINPEYSLEGLTLKLKLQYFGHPMQRANSLEKTDAVKDWGQKEKRLTEDEMAGWHHWLNGDEFEQTLGDSEGRRSLACYSPWGHKESDTTEWLTSKDKDLTLLCSVLKSSPVNATNLGLNPWVRKIPWRRERQPTPVFLPEKSHAEGSLPGYGHDLATDFQDKDLTVRSDTMKF